MSILIKGIEMPKEGEYRMTLYVCSDGSAYIDVYAFPLDADKFEAVSIPPHGELIDRDSLRFPPSEFWGFQATDNAKSAEAIVNDAPTIIPAE